MSIFLGSANPKELPKQINIVASSSATGPKSTITKTSDGLPGSTGTSNSRMNVGAIIGGKLQLSYNLTPDVQ